MPLSEKNIEIPDLILCMLVMLGIIALKPWAEAKYETGQQKC